MPAPKKALPTKKGSARKKADPDQVMLDRYQHHRAMRDKHSAQADLIEAKLRTQGKRIGYGDYDTPKPSAPKMRIVKER